jgi:hypothetical protein
VGLLVGLLPAPIALAADPAAGFSATWQVTRPDSSVRTDDAIAVGDDLAVSYAAVDGTPISTCQITVFAMGGESMGTPGVIENGECRMEVRIPAFPDPTERNFLAGIDPDHEQLDLCVMAGMTFADGIARTLREADHLQPGGRNGMPACGAPDSSDHLDFRVDPTGARRQFSSTPRMLSWDPEDWGVAFQPLEFGAPWHLELPSWVTQCWPYLNGSWVTVIRPESTPGCDPWDLRVPGVLPSTLPWEGGPGSWSYELVVSYSETVPGPGSSTISAQRVPFKASDGIFTSSKRTIFPTDLATTRFVHAGDVWKPTFQVTGGTVETCILSRITIPPTFPTDPPIWDRFTGTADADNQCSFEIPALAVNEEHQYYITVAYAGEGESTNTTFGGNITGIEPSTPPVIDPPTAEPGGDTGIGVDPGEGNGLAVDVTVTAATTSSASGNPAAALSLAATQAPCTDRALAPDLSVGGGIPHLDARCPLPPGTYTATATMVDAAGVTTTSKRTFTVTGPNVSGKTPGPGETNVPRDVHPAVQFDRAVTGVSAGTVRLQNTVSNAFVPATVSYDAAQHRATLSPAALLAAGVTYRLSVSDAIKSSTGIPMVATSWTFGVTPDALAPTATAPLQTLAPAALSGGLLPVRIAWSGSDASGIRKYALDQQVDGGPWGPVTAGTTATAMTRNVAAGHTYRFRVRPTDNAGNPGAWVYGTGLKVTAIQQTNAAITYRGTWSTLTSSTSWWGGSAKSSTMAGSTATYKFSGRSFAWVGLRSPIRGKAQVYVDGVLKATIDLYAAAIQPQRIVWSVNYGTSASRTVRIQVLGTAGRPRVDVDGFIVGS